MGKKKNLKDLDEFELDIINSKMMGADKDSDTINNKLFDYKIQIKCKNKKQKEFLKQLKNDKKIIYFGVGSAGSGKSYISIAYALQELKENIKYKRIVCLVPTCEAGNLNIGFLKGTLAEKIEPYIEADTYTMEKILNNSGNLGSKQIITNLLKNEIISYELVNFIRGKTFDNSIILINEAENYSQEEILLLLTRIGENSKIIITGDLEQLDRKDIKRANKMCGLEYSLNKLKDMEEVDTIEFNNEDIVRNPIITKILNIWHE